MKRYYPWLVVTFSALFLFYKYILQVSPSVMANELMRSFHIDGAGLGNLAATFFYAYLVAQLCVGPLLDRFSPRYLTAMAIAVCAAGAFLFASSSSLLHAELARGLIGVGAAFATVSYLKIAAVWFKPNQFAFVGGLLATAAMVGALFGQAPLSLMVDYMGWRQSLYYSAYLGFAIALLFVLVVKDKQPVLTNNISKLPTQKVSLANMLKLLKSKRNWLLTFYSGLAFSPVAVFGGLWGNPFLEEAYHLSKTHAASLTSFVFLGLALGGPLFGLLSDRRGNRMSMMAFGTCLSLFAVLPVLYVTNQPLWLLGVCLFLFGFGTGSFMLGFAMGKEINSMALAATVIALINTGDAIFGAFTEPLIGRFLDIFWSGKIVNNVHYFSVSEYRFALALLPAYLCLALFSLYLLRRGLKKESANLLPRHNVINGGGFQQCAD